MSVGTRVDIKSVQNKGTPMTPSIGREKLLDAHLGVV